MRPELQFDFLVDKDQNTITIRREFDGKKQLLWDCHTQSHMLDQWFAPRPLTTKTRSMDFREGGHWHYAMIDPDGQEYWGRMDYLTINPTDGYTLHDGFCDETGALNPDLPRATWHVTFTAKSERSLVTTIVSYPSQEALQQVMEMGMQEGLTSTLDRLDELLLTAGQ